MNDVFVERVRKVCQKIVDGAGMSYGCLHDEAKHGYHRQPPCNSKKTCTLLVNLSVGLFSKQIVLRGIYRS